MKRILFTLGLGVLSFAALSAAPADNLSDEQRAQLEQQIKAAAAKLELTDAQKESFVAISKKYGPQMLAIRDSDQGRLQKARQLRKLMSARNAEMEELLNEEQFATYQELQKQMRERLREQQSQR